MIINGNHICDICKNTTVTNKNNIGVRRMIGKQDHYINIDICDECKNKYYNVHISMEVEDNGNS